MRATGSGPVTKRMWTPEEEAYYKSLPGPGKVTKAPIPRHEDLSPEEQSRRARLRYTKQQEAQPDMTHSPKEGPNCGLTKEIFLEQLAAGETISSIEKAWSMKYNSLGYWVGKWNLRGITADKAAVLVEKAKRQAAANVATTLQAEQSASEGQPAPTELLRKKEVTPQADSDAAAAEFRKLKAENAELLKRLEETERKTVSHSMLVDANQRIKELEEAMQGAAVVATQAGARITELEASLSQAKIKAAESWTLVEDLTKQRDDLQAEVSAWRNEHKNWNRYAAELKKENVDLKQEYEQFKTQSQQQILELQYQLAQQAREAVKPAAGLVTLTYVLQDFGGDRNAQRQKCVEEANEYCEEIEASSIDLTRTVSELYDAGQAFVGLIRKHMQELMMDDPDASVQQYFSKHNDRHLAKMRAKAGMAG